MAQKEYSTKRGRFQHLTSEKRAQIEILLRKKAAKSQIAREVGISRSTLYNELARGTVMQMDSEFRSYRRYFADAGQRVYQEHRRTPEAINNRVEFGHWEIDTVIGKQETAAVLLTLDERTTR